MVQGAVVNIKFMLTNAQVVLDDILQLFSRSDSHWTFFSDDNSSVHKKTTSLIHLFGCVRHLENTAWTKTEVPRVVHGTSLGRRLPFVLTVSHPSMAERARRSAAKGQSTLH
jgi:hypothetical protein